MRDVELPVDQQPMNRRTMVMLAAAVCLYLGLRILSLWTLRLWGDEVFTFSVSQGPWPALIKRAGLDMAHPPLFYLLLKLWIYLADSSMFVLRVLPVSFAIVAAVPLIALGRKLGFRMPVIILTLTLMAVNEYLIVYSYYLRSYSLLLFLTLSSEALFVRFLRTRTLDQTSALVVLTVVNLLFVYTHYFGWLVVAAEYLWVASMDRRNLRRFTFANTILVLSFLPWVGVIVYVSTLVSYTFLDQITWFRAPGLRNLLLLLRCFNGGFNSSNLSLAGNIIFLVVLLVGLKNSLRPINHAGSKEEGRFNPYLLLVWLTTFPIVVSFAVSKAFTWIWEPRYVIVSTGSYLLLVSACAFNLRNRYARAAAVVFLLAWSSIAGFNGNLAEILHGPNVASYWLARDLSQRETRTAGPISIYGLSPYAEQGLRLALNLTGERRFKTIACPADVTFSDDYFWIAITEQDPVANARVKQLSTNTDYRLGEPIYRGDYPQRHILISVQRLN